MIQCSLIVAIAENRVIGKDNDLIWHLPADMAYFKETTLGKPVIMGRKNYLSIPQKFRPLPKRPNIVVTRNKSFTDEGIDVCYSVEEAIELAKTKSEDEIFIIGGGEIYRYALENKLCDKLYITEIQQSFDGDTFFPELNKDEWTEISRIKNPADDKNRYDFDFVQYVRKDS